MTLRGMSRRKIMPKSYQLNRLSSLERQGTTYHTWVTFKDGGNPYKTKAEVKYLERKIKDSAKRYNVRLVALSILEDHIHMLPTSPEGVLKISRFWKSVNIFIALKAKEKGISGKVFRGPVQYSMIERGYELYCAARYIHNNGKRDGHAVLKSTENEYRYREPDISDPTALRDLTGAGFDDSRLLICCSDDEFPTLAARYEPLFKKHKHLFKIASKGEN